MKVTSPCEEELGDLSHDLHRHRAGDRVVLGTSYEFS